MSQDTKYDPFDGFKQISEMWEKQINNLLFKAADNNEFVRLTKVGIDAHARYLELLRKNQEIIAGIMNIPTKKDVANVAKLSIQAEEKIDILEEQIWNIQDSLVSINNQNIELFSEMMKIVKQMKLEFQKNIEEISEIKTIQDNIQDLGQEVKLGINVLGEIKEDIARLKGLMEKEGQKGKGKDKSKELVVTK